MIRLRFIKSDDKKFLYTSQLCLVMNKLMFVKIKLKTLTAHVRNIEYPREDVACLSSNNLLNLKKMVKDWLLANGTSFKTEVKNK